MPVPLVHSKQFIFEECGFDWIPDYIDRDRLYNVSFNTCTGEIKLYLLDESGTFLYKVSTEGITKQTGAEDIGAERSRLSEFLDYDFNYHDILLDTVEGDTYYVYIEESSPLQYTKFLAAVCRKYGIEEQDLIQVVNGINATPVTDLRQCSLRKAVSLVKVPFSNRRCKLYSRPFNTGDGYPLNERTVKFLTRVHDCTERELRKFIRHLWVSSELFTDRIVVTTQYHQLHHKSHARQPAT